MRLNFVALIAVCGLSLLAGCGSESANPIGGVAIVDLDTVAKRVGKADQMNQSVKQKEASLNQQLAKLQASLKEQLDKKKNAMSEKPTPEEQQQLTVFEQQVLGRLNQVKQQGQQALANHQNALVLEFRNDVKPLLREIAAEQGLSIVIPKDERLLLTFEASVDITEKLIDKLKAENPAPKTTAAAN